ncbi:MAG: 3-hydroxy-5-phosphonooxypentane-2,4-dione thiolase [Acidaminococcaceae bacterium]
MADKDGNILAKDYGIGTPPPAQNFPVKGLGHMDWGMKTRLAQIFDPCDGRTIMLAFDHGYIMGSTAGLERLDLVIPPLMQYADCLMATRGALRTCIPPTHRKAIALRCTADNSVLKEDMSHGVVGVDIEEALRLNASCMAVQCFVGADGEIGSLDNLVRTVNAGQRYSLPVLGVVAVGKEMERTTRYFALATRLVAELGAHIIKTYYCDNFEQITAACPVPIVIAGGKKVPEAEALAMAYRAINEGAAGVDMGRNVLQAENPRAMLQALRMVVHEDAKPEAAIKAYKKMLKDVK